MRKNKRQNNRTPSAASQKNQRAALSRFWGMSIAICLLGCIFALIFASVMGYVPAPKKQKAAPTPTPEVMGSSEADAAPTATPTPRAIQKSDSSAALAQTADGGLDYLNAIYFFGDGSLDALNTENLLFGDERDHQVWMPNSGVLDLNVLSSTLYRSPVTGNDVAASEVVQVNQPKYVILLPSADNVQDVTASTIQSAYTKVISDILLENSETVIILSSLTPAAADCEDVDNETINTVNGYIAAAAEANDVYYLDAAYEMSGSDGSLPANLTDDGMHLNADGVKNWLDIVMTHVPG